jgi:hypothetical protein
MYSGQSTIAATKVVDTVRLESLSQYENRNLPLRIPLGTNAVGIMRAKCTENAGMFERTGLVCSEH